MGVQEEQRAEGLVPRGCSDVLLGGQVREERAGVRFARPGRVLFLVEEHVAPDLAHVRFFRPYAVVLQADGPAYLVEQLGFRHAGCGWGGNFVS